jgi:hypothetical protein
MARWQGACRWTGRGKVLGSSTTAKRRLRREREWRRGSSRRLGIGGVAGSGRRSGVPVEGGSGGVAASSGAVLQLEAEAREGTASVVSERRRKHGVEEKNPADGGSTLLMGGDVAEGGPGSQAACGAERGREGGGPERGRKRLGWSASAPGVTPRVTKTLIKVINK